MSVLAIISDTNGSGKTATTSALIIQLRKLGLDVTAIKLSYTPDDNNEIENNVYSYLQPESEYPASINLNSENQNKPDIQNLKSIAKKTASKNNLLVLEMTSLTNDALTQNIINELDAKVLIVSIHSPNMPGIPLRKLTNSFGERLIGVIINKQLRYRKTELNESILPKLSKSGIECLGVIPEDKSLMAISLNNLAKYLKANLVTAPPPEDKLINYFLVGGMGLDPGKSYFETRIQKAVVIRGDRPDLQMASLETDPECLILTKGIGPIEYVKYEAEEKDVPIYVVEKSTQQIMSDLDGIQTTVNFNHPAKIETFSQAFSKYINIEPVSSIFD
jgi:BioD-like phosphotransacetylase family protein